MQFFINRPFWCMLVAISALSMQCCICTTRCHMRRRLGREAGQGRVALYFPTTTNGRVVTSPLIEPLPLRPLRRFPHLIDSSDSVTVRSHTNSSGGAARGQWHCSRVVWKVPYFTVSSTRTVLQLPRSTPSIFSLVRSVPRVLVTHAPSRLPLEINRRKWDCKRRCASVPRTIESHHRDVFRIDQFSCLSVYVTKNTINVMKIYICNNERLDSTLLYCINVKLKRFIFNLEKETHK